MEPTALVTRARRGSSRGRYAGYDRTRMTLTNAVQLAVAEWCGAVLSAEQRLGRANQVDFAGRSTSAGEVRVEFERRREDPVNNVVKAWRQAAQNQQEPPFTLVHVFSAFYLSKKDDRKH